MAAVEKIEEQRKPEDFFGHRNSEEHDEQPSRRRKVRLAPFPSVAENFARFLAPPLPTKLQFCGGPI